MKRDMTIKQKLVYMVTGKFPEEIEDSEEVEEVEDIENIEEFEGVTEDENNKNIENTQKKKSAEQKFQEKTHMTKEEALKKISEWEKNGEEKKAKQGKKLFQEYFPASAKASAGNASTPKNSKKKKSTTNPLKFLKKSSENPLSAFGISKNNPDSTNLPDENSIEDTERTFAALSYVPFMSFFVVFARKDSAFVQFHAWQGVTIIAVFLASFPVYWILSFIPGVGFLFWLFTLFIFIGSVFACITAWNGRYISLPLVSAIAKSLSGRQ